MDNVRRGPGPVLGWSCYSLASMNDLTVVGKFTVKPHRYNCIRYNSEIDSARLWPFGLSNGLGWCVSEACLSWHNASTSPPSEQHTNTATNYNAKGTERRSKSIISQSKTYYFTRLLWIKNRSSSKLKLIKQDVEYYTRHDMRHVQCQYRERLSPAPHFVSEHYLWVKIRSQCLVALTFDLSASKYIWRCEDCDHCVVATGVWLS